MICKHYFDWFHVLLYSTNIVCKLALSRLKIMLSINHSLKNHIKSKYNQNLVLNNYQGLMRTEKTA